MTHLIEHWYQPDHVKAIQTTNKLNQHQNFDIHPNHADAKLINQLIDSFNLPHQPHFMRQVHHNRVIEYINQPESQLSVQADACFTRQPSVICAVMTADCLPVLLTDSAGSFVAAVHCGWRSLYANILSETINKINSEHPITAWLGPCIQQPQYQVDEAFVINYLKQQPNSQQAFTPVKQGKSLASLNAMAQIQLHELGVKHIQTANQCTFLRPDYYSWRQNKTAKRMATMLWMTAKQDC
jgi:YfiH family protein